MTDKNNNFTPKIAAPAVRSFINYCERQGLERNALLDEANLSESQLNDARLLIDSGRYERLNRFASRLAQDDLLGFHFGQINEPDRWGVLGYLAMTSPSLLAALDIQYRFQSLSGNMGAPLRGINDDTVTIQWVPAYNCSHHMSEQIVTGLVSLARQITNTNSFNPIAVFFTHAPFGNTKEYEDYFNCRVHFSADFNGLSCELDALKKPVRRSDPELHKVLIQQAQALLEEQGDTSPLEVIKDYVIKTLPDHVPEIEEVAAHLNISVRSTQRKLKEYGTSFSQVLDAIRKELALTYLQQTQNSVIYISERLGFSEQSAFQRAFKRWTGTTPRQYRLENKN